MISMSSKLAQLNLSTVFTTTMSGTRLHASRMENLRAVEVNNAIFSTLFSCASKFVLFTKGSNFFCIV